MRLKRILIIGTIFPVLFSIVLFFGILISGEDDDSSNSYSPVYSGMNLEELQNPEDTAHARIYDRLTEMCTPVRITGENFRKAKAREKMERLKMLLNRKESL